MTSPRRFLLVVQFVATVQTAGFAYDFEYLAKPLLMTDFHHKVFPVMLKASTDGITPGLLSDVETLDFIASFVPNRLTWTPQLMRDAISTVLNSVEPEKVNADVDSRVHNRQVLYSSGRLPRATSQDYTVHCYSMVIKFYIHKLLIELIHPSTEAIDRVRDCQRLQGFLRGDFRPCYFDFKANSPNEFNYMEYFEMDKLMLVMPRIVSADYITRDEYNEILFTVIDLLTVTRIGNRFRVPMPNYMGMLLQEAVHPVRKSFFKSLVRKPPKLVRINLPTYFKLMEPGYSLRFINNIIFPFIDSLSPIGTDSNAVWLYLSGLESTIEQFRRGNELPSGDGNGIARHLWEQVLRMEERIFRFDVNIHIVISTAAILSKMFSIAALESNVSTRRRDRQYVVALQERLSPRILPILIAGFHENLLHSDLSIVAPGDSVYFDVLDATVIQYFEAVGRTMKLGHLTKTISKFAQRASQALGLMKPIYTSPIEAIGWISREYEHMSDLFASVANRSNTQLVVELQWLLSTNQLSPRDLYLAAGKVPVLIFVVNKYIFGHGDSPCFPVNGLESLRLDIPYCVDIYTFTLMISDLILAVHWLFEIAHTGISVKSSYQGLDLEQDLLIPHLAEFISLRDNMDTIRYVGRQTVSVPYFDATMQRLTGGTI